jgi:catechol 2,3-dioxygenase-like lactoylglutathione lyase family enzyme
MRIGLTGIFVDDQDRAERFYTEVLGFQVKTSAAYGPGERWLSVVAPEEPDGVQLVLHLTDEPARAFREASRELGRPVLSLTTGTWQLAVACWWMWSSAEATGCTPCPRASSPRGILRARSQSRTPAPW